MASRLRLLDFASRPSLLADEDLIEQLRVGWEVEHEHDDVTGGSPLATAQIAAAHLREDPLYYMPLLALERFLTGQAQAPRVRVEVDKTGGEASIVLGIEGVPMPVWAAGFRDAAKALAIRDFLRDRPALAIVYAWMNLHRPEIGSNHG